MRLRSDEIDSVKKIITRYFGKSRIYLFGSRLNDDARGGDIDIFVIPENMDELPPKSAKAQFLLENALLKPVDILVHCDFDREIEKEALNGIEI